MALYRLLLPKMGESVAEATIIKWNKTVGDHIEMDDTVVEIATDKVDSEVPSPVSGKLVEQLCNEDDVIQIGSAIAVIETEEAEQTPDNNEAAEAAVNTLPVEANHVAEEDASAHQPEQVATEPLDIPGINQIRQDTLPVVQQAAHRFYSPLVKSIAIQEKISVRELDSIPGTGAEGRLTKDDLLNYLKIRGDKPFIETPAAVQPVSAPAEEQIAEEPKAAEPEQLPVLKHEAVAQQAVVSQPKPPQPVAVSKPAVSLNSGDEIIEMDRMRRLIADHMVMSVHTSPHVTSFVEADVTNMVLWREKVKTSFEQREGTKITFTPIFIEAVARAIKDMPMINISVNGTQIIKKRDINIGMATALPSGNLIVPVIRRADQLNLVGLSKAVNDLSNRARNNKLQPEEVKEGTFTITNIGSFGNIMGTPIINQPQVAILAVGAIKKKPAVIETPQGDGIAIRHMMYLSLSYDHRVVDGALGGSFVRRVADYLEAWDVNRSY